MTLKLPFSPIPLGFPLRRNWNYLLDVEFATPAAAPIPNPYEGEVSRLNVTDSSSILSVTGGELVASAGTVTGGDPAVYSALTDLLPGRAAIARFKIVSSPGSGAYSDGLHWASAITPSNVNDIGFNFQNASNLRFVDGAINISGEPTPSLDTYYVVTVLALPSGWFGFIDKHLVWIGAKTLSQARALVFDALNAVAAGNPLTVDYVRIKDFDAPFTTNFAIAVVDVASPVSGTDYTGTADGICDLTITAPNPLAGTTGFRFHHTSNNDCDFVYTDSTTGRLRLDTVVGGVATNRISVNSVFSVGATNSIRAIYTGGLKDVYSLSGTTWTKRGAQVNVSNQPTQKNVAPVIGGSYTVANLREYDRSAASYSVLDGA